MPETPVVTLRPRTETDGDVLYRIAADLDTWEERSPEGPYPLTREQYDARLEATARRQAEGTAVFFVVDVADTPVGSATLFDIDPLTRTAEVGITLAADARGRGLGTAAIGQLVRFAFVRRNLRRVHLQAVASNAAAIRAYEKVGFVHEGRQREHAWVRGRYEDIVRMGLLRSEWSAC